jgi:phosphoesterase RecJ-like protein
MARFRSSLRKQTTTSLFLQWRDALKTARTILLTLHHHPDGDSIASNLALARILRLWGKRVTIVSHDSLPHQFSFLPGFTRIKRRVFWSSLNLQSFEAWISLDTTAPSRAFPPNFSPPSSWRIYNIDHHITNTYFGHFNLVDCAAASTCEIIARAARIWRVPLSASLATTLLTGVLTDSAGLLNTATTAETLRTAARLVEAGGNLAQIVLHVFRSIPPSFLKFWGEVLRRTKIMRQGKWRFAGACIPYRIWRSSRLTQASFAHEMAVNMFLAVIKNTDFGYLLTEIKPRIVRGSLRARAKVNVARIAQMLGGGGHAAAAGLTLEGKTIAEAERELKRAIARLG